ncbi:MAG: hypothetical protein GF320_15120 [Armatimonadia bacterium]|nr:hypothetical protein [Armatimonadia bacterium]
MRPHRLALAIMALTGLALAIALSACSPSVPGDPEPEPLDVGEATIRVSISWPEVPEVQSEEIHPGANSLKLEFIKDGKVESETIVDKPDLTALLTHVPIGPGTLRGTMYSAPGARGAALQKASTGLIVQGGENQAVGLKFSYWEKGQVPIPYDLTTQGGNGYVDISWSDPTQVGALAAGMTVSAEAHAAPEVQGRVLGSVLIRVKWPERPEADARWIHPKAESLSVWYEAKNKEWDRIVIDYPQTTGMLTHLPIGPGMLKGETYAAAHAAGETLQRTSAGITIHAGQNDETSLLFPTKGELLSFNIYRADETGGPYEQINATSRSTTAFQDTGLVNGQDYFYVVTALDITGKESEYSDEILGQPREPVFDVPVPENVTAAAGDLAVIIDWDEPAGAEDVMGYYVYMTDGPSGDYWRVNTTPIGNTGPVEIPVDENEITYYFVVRSVAEYNLIEYLSPSSSPPVTATPGTGDADVTITSASQGGTR